jgi:hypothetical protein
MRKARQVVEPNKRDDAVMGREGAFRQMDQVLMDCEER